MGIGHASAQHGVGLERVDQVVRRFEEEWADGRPDLERHLAEAGRLGSVSVLAALVKADLRCRYDRGERPAAAEYMERYPDLRATGDRALSLVYEEYCLLEERNERPDTAEFCARYGPWKDSLESQLRYHRVLSRVAGASPPSPRFPAEGERFEQFLVREELGRGGAGRVYRASDESLGGREVALKISNDRGSEPAILGRLVHDHIVPVHSVVHRDGDDGTKLRGLCMPYRPGLPLDRVITLVNPAGRPARAGALFDALRRSPPAHAAALVPGGAGWDTFPARGSYADGVAWVVAVLADALGYAHSKKIYHRDVKPANVLLTYREGPQLLDFNLSHDPHSAVEAEAALRGGTLPYMAPEQLEAFRDPALWGDVTGPADLYSLGLLLRELLTGLAPETPDPLLPLPRAILSLIDRRRDFRPDLRRLNPTVPHALDAIAGRCLAYDTAGRYQDAADLAGDLRQFLARRPLKHARNPSSRERVCNWAARYRVPLAAAVLIAAAGVAAHDRAAPAPEPIETRRDFLDAVRHLAAGQPADAVGDLNRLGHEADGSTVASFYSAAANALAGHIPTADEALERVARPDAENVLAAWGAGKAEFARQAMALGGGLLNQIKSIKAGRRAAATDRVAKTLHLVLRLDPRNDNAVQGLATVDEARKQYGQARHSITTLINPLGRPETTREPKKLLVLLTTRARISTLWGESQGNAPAVAAGHFDDASADLDLADELIESGDDGLRFDHKYIGCSLALARGGLAVRRGRYPEALANYQEAVRLLDELSAHVPPARAGAARIHPGQGRGGDAGRGPEAQDASGRHARARGLRACPERNWLENG